MRWRKRDLWKASIVIAGVLLVVHMTLVPVSAAGAYEGVSEPATPGTVTVQTTPTEDATVTALNKEKLAQEVQQLKEQNEPDLLGWLRSNASILLSTLVVVIGGLIGLFRWLGDRRDAQDKELKNQQNEREKRAEERFQAAVAGLGDDKEGAKIGAAILLRTFLRPGYEQFYIQTFDLAVANLRLRNVDPNTPEPLNTLSQALITVFKESFPLARDRLLEEETPPFSPRSLDATGIQLDKAYLFGTDLKQVWMRQASLRKANLSGAYLEAADLEAADLSGANLSSANLNGANLNGVDLHMAGLFGTFLLGTNLSRADLREAYLERAFLKDTNLRGVTGLTKEQLAICKAKGAIVDDDPVTSSSQSTVAPSSPSQSNDAQASSAPSAQGNVPTPDAGESSAASSQQSTES